MVVGCEWNSRAGDEYVGFEPRKGPLSSLCLCYTSTSNPSVSTHYVGAWGSRYLLGHVTSSGREDSPKRDFNFNIVL